MTAMEDPGKTFRSGFIGIIGRPNVGKSTLLNRVVGEKIAITTAKPQTTRDRIMGIRTTGRGQFIFIDTPGIHPAHSMLNRHMVSAALRTLDESDVLLFMVEAKGEPDEKDGKIIDILKGTRTPVFLAINKIDLVPKEALLPRIDGMRALYGFREILPLCARTGFNVDRLLDLLWNCLPEGPPLYPGDMITDRTERFIASEIIREKITLLCRKEIPYHIAVTIESFREEPGKNLVVIQATAHAARDSQKGILIGRGGRMLKEIGRQARLEMESFFGKRVFLELFVRVTPDWPEDERMLREFGYTRTG
ncbi:MAG TPA: GTPase Era [Syntrophales bacterium]|nr:GTPase Era [Syntrophales bacterium]HQN79063.1 GTPase Era [Syntrophales bacterium]HQQ28228.1 GTPase Era [Syntrophales bacterium]